MTTEAQIKDLEKQLKEVYLKISDSYKMLSKFSDEFRINNANDMIAAMLRRETELREKLTKIRADI